MEKLFIAFAVSVFVLVIFCLGFTIGHDVLKTKYRGCRCCQEQCLPPLP